MHQQQNAPERGRKSRSIPIEVAQAIAVARDACQANVQSGALRFALEYLTKVDVARGEDLRTQILYALNNMGAWRSPAAVETKRILARFATGRHTQEGWCPTCGSQGCELPS